MKRGDIIIVICLIGIIIGTYGFNYFSNQTSDPLVVEVRVNAKLMDKFSLDETVNKVYETEYGMNTLSIENNIVSVVDADCRDFICVNTKDGTASGDAIVCIPNRFTVEIIGAKSEVDVIAQ